MHFVKRLLTVTLLCSAGAFSCFGAATITIVNADGAGEGFNDPTIVAPVGGNPGATLGQQRLNVFQAVANVWGATLTSVPTVLVLSQFNPLTCTASGTVQGSAGPRAVFSDPSGLILSPANTLFHVALANKLSGVDQSPASAGDSGEEIGATFNSNMGGGGVGVAPGCGFTFYMGLDNAAPAGQIDLFASVLHEFAHGLGFSTTTNGSTGARFTGLNHKFDTFLFDLTQNLAWSSMTNAQRVMSAINSRKLVWTGANVTAAVPTVLNAGTPELVVSAPSSLARIYLASAFQGTSTAYPNLTFPGLFDQVMPASDFVAPLTDACSTITPASALGLVGNIALVDRGLCTFNTKLANVAAAGAVGMILVNNAPGSPPPVVGADATPAIPSLMISQSDGAALRDFLRFRSRTSSGLFATIRLNTGLRSGADSANRMLMHAPNPFAPGSSVSHFDPIAFPHQLMEPAVSVRQSHSVIPPSDLTFRLLQDMGW